MRAIDVVIGIGWVVVSVGLILLFERVRAFCRPVTHDPALAAIGLVLFVAA